MTISDYGQGSLRVCLTSVHNSSVFVFRNIMGASYRATFVLGELLFLTTFKGDTDEEEQKNVSSILC